MGLKPHLTELLSHLFLLVFLLLLLILILLPVVALEDVFSTKELDLDEQDDGHDDTVYQPYGREAP